MKEITENPFYHYRAPKKPVIRKLGTILCDTVEATPLVFRGKLYRFESVRPHSQNPANPEERSFFRFVDAEKNTPGAPFGYGHHLGSAFAADGFVAVTGVKGTWGGDTVTVFRSEDLLETIDAEVFDFVDNFVAFVIPGGGITFGVFIGQR